MRAITITMLSTIRLNSVPVEALKNFDPSQIVTANGRNSTPARAASSSVTTPVKVRTIKLKHC